MLFTIKERPWFIDHVEDWLVRLEEGPHRCAAIFVDNSGMDVILGVLPFARELLNRGTKVKMHPVFLLTSITIVFRIRLHFACYFSSAGSKFSFCHDDTVEEPSGTNVTRRLAKLALGSEPES